MKLLVACTTPRGETGRKPLQRQEFAARQLGGLAGPDGDAAARAVMGPAGAVRALLRLLEGGNDKGAGVGSEEQQEKPSASLVASFGKMRLRDGPRRLCSGCLRAALPNPEKHGNRLCS